MKLVVNMTGTTPLVMHNPRLVDPLYEITKAIKELTSQKPRTDEIDAQIAELEFKGGLYINEQGPYVEAQAIRKTWIMGARLSKKGKAVERGVTMLDIEYPLIFTGPRDAEELWKNKDFVWRAQTVIPGGKGRVMRTRPQFAQWALDVAMDLDLEMLNRRDFERVISDSGLYIGLLEARSIGRGKFTTKIQNGTA